MNITSVMMTMFIENVTFLLEQQEDIDMAPKITITFSKINHFIFSGLRCLILFEIMVVFSKERFLDNSLTICSSQI